MSTRLGWEKREVLLSGVVYAETPAEAGSVFCSGFREQGCQGGAEVIWGGDWGTLRIMGLPHPSCGSEVRNCDCRSISRVGNGTAF